MAAVSRPPIQTSSVHALLAVHTEFSYDMMHPEASAAASPGLHVLMVQAMLSSQATPEGAPEQVPSAAHTSLTVHTVPSSHAPPAGSCVCTLKPVTTLTAGGSLILLLLVNVCKITHVHPLYLSCISRQILAACGGRRLA